MIQRAGIEAVINRLRMTTIEPQLKQVQQSGQSFSRYIEEAVDHKNRWVEGIRSEIYQNIDITGQAMARNNTADLSQKQGLNDPNNRRDARGNLINPAQPAANQPAIHQMADGRSTTWAAGRPVGQSGVSSNLSAPYEPLINAAASRFNLNPALIRSVIMAESGFQPTAKSPKGAEGLMQLMPATAKGLGVNNSFDPKQNIFGGASYLRTMLNRFKGDERLALAAYNAGPGAVQKYGGVPPYPETRKYVARVLSQVQNGQ